MVMLPASLTATCSPVTRVRPTGSDRRHTCGVLGNGPCTPLSSLISAWLHRGSAVAGLSFLTYQGEGTRKATDGQWRQPVPQTPRATT